jgi:beta-glucosidase/6-phospho-beta-glucosidase/beta-galactosidase
MSTWTTEDRKEAEKIMNNDQLYFYNRGFNDCLAKGFNPIKELTDEEIEKVFVLNCNLINETFAYRDFARAILRKAQEK